MLVKELLDKLNNMDGNMEVVTSMLDPYSNSNELVTLSIKDATSQEFEDEENNKYVYCFLSNEFVELVDSFSDN